MTYNERLTNLNSKTFKIFEKLGNFPERALCFSDQKWSVLEILYHVWLAEISSEKYIRTKIQYPETILNTPLLSYVKAFLTKYFLLLGLTIKAPEITAKFPDKISLKELQNNWVKSRYSFSKLIDELEQKKLADKAIFRHALMGRINLSLTLYFFELHFNHHLKQINKRISAY